MKKVITIVIIVLIAVGFGYFLFKISPQEQQQLATSDYKLDTSGAKQMSAPSVFDPATDHFTGNPKAKNIFIEYSDFQCPACAAFAPVASQVSSSLKDTVFVYRYFPLEQIHKNAVVSALAAEAAGAQGKYWEMHDILFAKQTDWENLSNPIDTFAQYAQQVGVSNIDQFKSDVTSKKYITRIERDNNEALGLSLPGTPSLFFNGKTIQSSDLAGIQKQVESLYVK